MKAPLSKSGLPLQERIALFGAEKSGKTFAWLTIALMHQKTHSPATFYVADTDLAVRRMLASERFASLDNIVYEEVYDWPGLRDSVAAFRKKIQPGDWLIVDMMTQAWEWVQQHYIERVYGVDVETYFLEMQKALKTQDKNAKLNFGEALEWPIINKMYQPWAQQVIGHAGHVLVTAAEKSLGKREVGKKENADYVTHGVKIAGQKYTGHLMHTILRVQAGEPGAPVFNTVGDRERELLVGETIKNFALGYLCKNGWKLR